MDDNATPAKNTVPNEGSTARDHLANERTFLAWIRTGLGVIGLGVVVERLVEGQGAAGQIAGLTLIGFGALVLLYSLYRYRRITAGLIAGLFPIARVGPWVISVGALLVAAAAAILLSW